MKTMQKVTFQLRSKLKEGDIGYLTFLHGMIYSEELNLDMSMESSMVNELLAFLQNYNGERDRIWLLEQGDRVLGSIAIVGDGPKKARLRWFALHESARGLGLGRYMIRKAIAFCSSRNYESIYLWTFSSLEGAKKLYQANGFNQVASESHEMAFGQIEEQKYVLHL